MIENLIKFYADNLTFYSIVIKKNGLIKNFIFWIIY